jgi:pSer/pThr/pTyr-binding forkhead associated (FHA) protein
VNPADTTRALAAAVLATEPDLAGAHLVVLQGPAAGRALPLREGAVLGRARHAELRVDDPLASRHHLRFTCVQGRWRIADLGSKNGFTVNGARPGPSSHLSPGDRLALGATVLGFEGGIAAGVAIGANAPTTDPPRGGAASSVPLLAAAALLTLAAVLAAVGG